MDSGALPQPSVFISAIVGLCGVVGILFRVVTANHKAAMDMLVAHHTRSMDEARAERAELMKVNREHAAAEDRLNKTVAQLITSFFFIPPDMKRHSEAVVREIEAAEKARERA